MAVREFVLEGEHGRVDYLLFVDGEPAGVIEAKPEGTSLVEVERQAGKYVEGLPDWSIGVRIAVRDGHVEQPRGVESLRRRGMEDRRRRSRRLDHGNGARRLSSLGLQRLRAGNSFAVTRREVSLHPPMRRVRADRLDFRA